MVNRMGIDLDVDLDAFPGTVSYWLGGTDARPLTTRHADATHYAASTMKVAVMVAAHRLADTGELDLDEHVAVHNHFRSATGRDAFANDPEYDNDPEPWRLVGNTASLRWLIRRMIIKSSNLATNIVLEHVGLDAVEATWTESGATRSTTARGIEDYAAREAGISNIVTAADLAALLCAIRAGALTTSESARQMIDVMSAQEANEPLHHGLPTGMSAASKSGWVDGVRHSMAIVTPQDAPEFVLTTCVSATDGDGASVDDDKLTDIITRVTAAAWRLRSSRELSG